jgi:TonB family protein
MRSFIRLAIAASLISFASDSPLAAQLSGAAQHLNDLARANSLDAEGTQPWHLHMTFQLNDLNGKPKDSGTIEEWWMSPQARRLEIRSTSYNLTIPSGPSNPPEPSTRTRESYLVNELLNQVVHPIPDYGDFKDLVVTEASRNFGKVTLSCISVSRPPRMPSQFCVAPGSPALRGYLGEGQFAAARNRMATFRGVELGLDNALAYGGKVAISGHVDRLESFQPNPSVALTSADPAIPSVIPGAVLAGRITKKVSPEYPVIARRDHISGTVVLCATISKQGTISGLDVVSSPDSGLTASAIDAVKQWTYQPYLINGSPVEVATTITVNYNLSY